LLATSVIYIAAKSSNYSYIKKKCSSSIVAFPAVKVNQKTQAEVSGVAKVTEVKNVE